MHHRSDLIVDHVGDRVDDRWVAHICGENMHIVTAGKMRHIRVPAGGEIVDNHHPMTISEEPIAQMRPDEAGPSGDDHPTTGRESAAHWGRPTPS